MKRGFTLIEVLVASVILTLGIVAVLGLFLQSYKLMTASARFETAQTPSLPRLSHRFAA